MDEVREKGHSKPCQYGFDWAAIMDPRSGEGASRIISNLTYQEQHTVRKSQSSQRWIALWE
jgi:hypothetical protein